MAFPTTLDTFNTTQANNTPLVNTHPTDHVLLNTAASALEAKVGIDGSAVTTSHAYKLSGVTGTDKAVSKTGTEALTNKTLTDPVISGSVYDDNGARFMQINGVPGTTNYIQAQTSSSGVGFYQEGGAQGAFNIGVKGESTQVESIAETGSHIDLMGHIEGTLNVILEAYPMTNGVNFFRMQTAAAGDPPRLDAVGPDTDVDMRFECQGNGDVIAGHLGDYPAKSASFLGYNTITGWVPARETWTYASASSINVPTGAASRYQVGDRIKWTQTTVKYGVIVVVADTLLTIAINTDYVVTNAAISANYTSHQLQPFGYPEWFNWTASATITNAPTSATTTAKYRVAGRMCDLRYQLVGTANGSNAGTTVRLTNPVTNAAQRANTAVTGTGYWSDDATFGEASASPYWFNTTDLAVTFSNATRKPTIISLTASYDI